MADQNLDKTITLIIQCWRPKGWHWCVKYFVGDTSHATWNGVATTEKKAIKEAKRVIRLAEKEGYYWNEMEIHRVPMYPTSYS